jgi:hypothetical protein
MSFLAGFVAGRTLSRAMPQGKLPQQVADVYRLASSSGGIIGNSNTATVTCAVTEGTQGPINGSNSKLLFRLHSTYTKGDEDKAPHRWVDDQDKRARAQESVFFKKEDEKLLRKLLNKVKVEAAHHDQQEAEIHAKDERAALQKIVGKYNVSEEDLEAILHWRHHEPVQ